MTTLFNAKSEQTLSALTDFLHTPLENILNRHQGYTPEEKVLELFQTVSQTVPAYQTLLQEQGIDPSVIKSLEAFRGLPLLNKQNYLQRFPLAKLCRNGVLDSCDMIAVSSGSTGQPTFWPRFLTDELQIATRFEQVFHDSFEADQRRTLAVISFALGTWVGGMYTTSCCRHLAAKGYPITVVSPGNNKEEIFRVVQELGPQFDQVVLLGYPPFLKDVIDHGLSLGISWQEYHLKWVMAGEVFSEEWRTLMGQRVGSTNPCFDSASLYGTADAGVLGNETPLSICIRRFLAERPELAKILFGESRLPTLVQYDPLSRFFEVQDGTLLFSGDNGIPLIRYHIADTGGIIPYEEMVSFLAQHGFNPLNELAGKRGVHPLPFVYVFGRSNFIISYFGANIYPENIAVGLEQPDIQDWVTGKFVMEVKEDTDRNRFLSITIELAPRVEETSSMGQEIGESIAIQLKRLNSEFVHYVPPAYQTPQITLLPTGDPDYFPVGVKHRYTRT